MTIRGGGRPRDRAQAHRYDPDEPELDVPWSADPREGGYGSGNGRRLRGRRGGGVGGLIRFLIFAVVLGAIVLTVALTALRPIFTEAVVGWAYDNPAALRIPFVADMVRERLGGALTSAASDDPEDVTFEVRQGDTVATVAARLAEQGLVRDPRAFTFQATLRSLQPQLKAGDFRLARNMTPDQLVTGLIQNEIVITVVAKTFRESLRIDQMATLISTWEEDLAVDGEEFREIANDPPVALLADYPWLATSGLPEGASLEGYLFPAQYDLLPDTTTEDLIRMMLDRFLDEVGEERVAEATFFERLTLASIVEREAKLQEERPLIAGVYQNRINATGALRLLQADPTVFYAIDTVALAELPFEQWREYVFWEPPGVALAEVPLPPELEAYNTYRAMGLPPGPICAPGITSIDAALAPKTDDGFFFFVALPDGTGAHDFSKTFEEHQQKLRDYGYL